MTTVIVNILGLLLMAAVVWWFWFAGRRRAVAVADGRIAIQVAQGAYTPDRIAVPAGTAVDMEFTRTDPSPCAGVVQFEGLDISRELPVDTPVSIRVRYEAPGEYAFTCQMGMYRGHIVVQ